MNIHTEEITKVSNAKYLWEKVRENKYGYMVFIQIVGCHDSLEDAVKWTPKQVGTFRLFRSMRRNNRNYYKFIEMISNT